MTVIGITGGTGAGKTTALDAIKELGGIVIDCDEVYHDLLNNSADMMAEIKTNYPGAFESGQFDRKALGKIVFSDESALLKLNEITHKYVGIEVDRRIAEFKAHGGKLAAIDAIALIESGLCGRCQANVLITAPKEVRARRIMARENISYEYAHMRINAQKDDEFFKAHCGYVLINDNVTKDDFKAKCLETFKIIINSKENTNMSELFYSKKHVSDVISAEEKKLSDEYCEGYKDYLNNAKDEREAVATAIQLAEAKGFKSFTAGDELKPGDKIYRSVRGKALFLAVIGKAPLSMGTNIAAAHVDSPRLDLKQVPLYEDSGMGMLKTHYYGGIKKFQWVTIPLALHGVVVKMDGTVLPVAIGEKDDDPVFVITDLLPHLGRDQGKKTLGEAFTGENLNITISSLPTGGEDAKDRFKLTVLEYLNKEYGITEDDLLSAELHAVPAYKAKDVGFDRSMIASYGHDDRSCAYAELKAILDIETPEKTAVCVLADKEEVGSDGISGMQSQAFENFMADICDTQNVKLRHCFEKSFCLSADVCNAFDPNFPEVSEKRNNAEFNCGMGILKFTGAGGKSGSSDASAELVAKLRAIFAKEGVCWQLAELGKVDQGGGGTVAKYMANRNIDTIDAGVPVLSMHAPYELVSKLDCYMTYKGVKAIYDEK